MADINNFRQLDFQESGEPADNDRVLIVEIDNDKVVGAKNYALAKLKGYISADALAYLEECRLINASVSEKEERVSNIASQSAELLESTRGETIESLEQTVTSTEPGGVNVFTITQKNGSQKSLQTRNGLRGPEGPQGPQGPAVPLVQTTGQSTTEAMSQKAVSDEFNQLKSDLDTKQPANYLDYNVFNTITSTTGYCTTNKPMTDYKLLIIQVFKTNTGEIINAIFPVDHFKEGLNAYIIDASTYDTSYYASFWYISPTTINIDVLNNISIFRIIGVL